MKASKFKHIDDNLLISDISIRLIVVLIRQGRIQDFAATVYCIRKPDAEVRFWECYPGNFLKLLCCR